MLHGILLIVAPVGFKIVTASCTSCWQCRGGHPPGTASLWVPLCATCMHTRYCLNSFAFGNPSLATSYLQFVSGGFEGSKEVVSHHMHTALAADTTIKRKQCLVHLIFQYFLYMLVPAETCRMGQASWPFHMWLNVTQANFSHRNANLHVMVHLVPLSAAVTY